MVKRWIYGVLALGLAASPAVAQTPNLSARPASTLPLPKYSGPYDPSQGQLYLNNLIVSLNNTLGTSLAVSATTPNMGTILAGATGAPVLIGVANAPNQTVDANAGIAVVPNGNGNVTLFYGNPASNGVLAFGNQAEWVPANGVDRCPGSVGASQFMAPNQGGVGLGSGGTTVTGYVPVQDWLGRMHKLVTCG